MLAGSDPAAVLAFTARRSRGLAAVHSLRDPSRELEAASAGILVDQQAMREPAGTHGRVHFIARRGEPGGKRGVAHDAVSGGSPRHSSSAAIAASQTWSSFAVASMTRKRLG